MGHNFAVAFFILVNTFIFVYVLIHKLQFSKNLIQELDLIIGRLGEINKDERGTNKVADHIKKAFDGSQIFMPFWNNYRSLLVSTDQISKEPLYSCHESGEIFNVESVMNTSSKFVSFSISNAVPQVLTSIGIIGTFLSIMISLDLPAGSKIDETFILELVRSVAAGFKSSLIGIGLAVTFIAIEKVFTKRISTRLSEVNFYLGASFPSLNAENLLIHQSHILGNLSVDIQSSISNGFAEMTGGLGSALADVLDDDTKKVIKDGVAASFTEMNAILSEVRNESKLLKGELEELRTAKKEMFENIKNITSEQNKIQREINDQSASLVDNLKEFEKAIAPLAEVAKQVQATNELSDKLISSVKFVSDATNQIEVSLSRAQEVTNISIGKIGDLTSRINTEYASLGANVESWVKNSNNSLESNLKEFDKVIGGVLNQVATITDRVNTGVISLERTVEKIGSNEKVSREA